MFTMRFDMRDPAWGAAPAELYAAVPEMCAWAEDHGGLAAVLCEHHGSEDGYLPSPMILAPAIAARTQRLALSLILLLPFYDPVRLAEDMAVLDIISGGRASYILALGYRPEEFEHFGVALSDRGRLADEKLPLLRRLLAGETVVHDGRPITVTPRPLTPGGPGLMWGGGTVAAARRAGRYGLGMLGNANEPGMREAYEAACRKARAHAGRDVLSRPRHPVGRLRRRRHRPGLVGTGRAPAARRAGLRSVEPRRRDNGGFLPRDKRRRAARQPGVARDYLGARSDFVDPRRQGA